MLRLRFNERFELTSAVFLRLLGVVYLISFASFLPQLPGLVGAHGIALAAQWMNELRSQGFAAFWSVPSVFWLNNSDAAMQTACVVGCICGLVMASGRLVRLAAAVCWILYLSIVSVGAPFSNFQWDALLLECGFLALFTGVPITGYAYRLVLFRLMFESGIVKLQSHDPVWHKLTALRYHFWTQPLPNPLAYYAAQLPNWALDSMTLATFLIELILPFLLWGPKRLRRIAAGGFMLLQVMILLTGNYAFFNLLTLALCFWAFDDELLEPLRAWLNSASLSLRTPWVGRAVSAAVAALMLMGVADLAGVWFPSAQTLVAWAEPLELVNRYGLFAVMTTSRTELIIEGSDDGEHWREYEFRYKPGSPNRELPVVAPYQPRLDWQMWFAALGTYNQNEWIGGLVYRLLQGDPATAALMGRSPFPHPPTWIRIEAYDYRFTTRAERSRSGAIWQRTVLGTWLNPVRLKR